MNVMIIGSGGREHALAFKMAQSPLVNELYICPGNAGTSQAGTNLPLDPMDFRSLAGTIRDKGIDMLVVGPEQPLAEGIGDYFNEKERIPGLMVIGPGKKGAALESSKDFAKAFMQRHDIPTAGGKTFTAESLGEGLAYLEQKEPPYVLKADGLAAGKGVIISKDLEEARSTLREMTEGQKFGKASEKVVVEDFLDGIELSVFVITDGKSYVLLPEAKDYKRIGEGDSGPNTGGMGSVSPVGFADKAFMQKVEERVIKPTIRGLQKESIPYTGFIFFGLMNVKGEPYVVEYNVRMGDPESQSVLPRIKSDLVEVLTAAAQGTLDNVSLEIKPGHCTSVILASGGYPAAYEKGKRITGLEKVSGALVFHAGTKSDREQNILTSGGRVLAVTAEADSLKESIAKAYNEIPHIQFDKKYYRSDIGMDLLTDK